jgi:hypothetical protein
MTVLQLIEALQILEETPDIKPFDEEYIVRDNPAALEASNIAENVLITTTGNTDWISVNLLRKAGYQVFPVEKDGFGWLIGGIHTGVGILTYG